MNAFTTPHYQMTAIDSLLVAGTVFIVVISLYALLSVIVSLGKKNYLNGRRKHQS